MSQDSFQQIAQTLRSLLSEPKPEQLARKAIFYLREAIAQNPQGFPPELRALVDLKRPNLLDGQLVDTDPRDIQNIDDDVYAWYCVAGYLFGEEVQNCELGRIHSFYEAVEPVTQMVERAGDGKPLAKRRGRVEWKVAQSLMLTRLTDGTLPKSIRDAANAIGKTNSTTRKAVHESDALKTHFGLSAEDTKLSPGKLLDELTSQADAHTKRYLKNLEQDEREDVEVQLHTMPANKRLELLKTLATSPDGGSCGDVPLYPNEPDPDSNGDDDDD
jgi:hypothetical protein